MKLPGVAAILVIAATSLARAQQPSPDEPIPPQGEAPAPTTGSAETPPPVAEAPPAREPAPEAAPAPRPLALRPPVEPVKPPEPPKPVRSPVAIVQALDKVTAETLRFAAPVGRRVRYKTLIFTVKACETADPDAPQPRASAYVVIQSQPPILPGRPAPEPRQVYKGWMFATAPGLHPFEHPVYDAWLIACSAAIPVA